MAGKVQRDEYSGPAEALQDVRLVWRNCHSFNEPGSEVYKACDELSGFVDQLWHQSRLPCPPPVPPPPTPSSAPAPAPHHHLHARPSLLTLHASPEYVCRCSCVLKRPSRGEKGSSGC